MKCSNCSEDALYTIAPVNVSKVHYCERHLPNHLRLGALEGLYPVEVPVTTTSKKKTAAPVVEEEPAVIE
jgi:hypothetical protein